MPLTITDFIEQVDGISTEDIPLDERERINDALADLTGGPGGGGPPVNNDAILVSKSLDDREGFNSIQSAVGSANTGNTIFVEPGEYSESVTIDVEDLTLKAADGESPVVTQNSGTVVDISADGVTVDGLTVKAGDGTTAVKLDGVSDGAAVTLTNNTIDLTVGNDSSVGIVAGSGSGISETIENNTFQANPDNFLGDSTLQFFVNDENNRVDFGTIKSENTFEPGVTASGSLEPESRVLSAAVPVDSDAEFLQTLADDRDAPDGFFGGPLALSESYTNDLDSGSIAGQQDFGSTVRVDINPEDISTSNSYEYEDRNGNTQTAISGAYIREFDLVEFPNVTHSGGQVFLFVPAYLKGEEVTIAVGNFDQIDNPRGWDNLSGDDIVIQNVTIEQ